MRILYIYSTYVCSYKYADNICFTNARLNIELLFVRFRISPFQDMSCLGNVLFKNCPFQDISLLGYVFLGSVFLGPVRVPHYITPAFQHELLYHTLLVTDLLCRKDDSAYSPEIKEKLHLCKKTFVKNFFYFS